MAEHLKVVDPVVAPQHADESADNVRKQRRVEPGLKAGQRRLIGAGTHIRGEDIQFSGENRTGILLIMLNHAQHIPAGGQFLGDGGHEPGQFRLNLVPLGREFFLRPANLFEINRHRQKNNYQRQHWENQQARNHRQQHCTGLDHGKGGVLLRCHVQPSSGQRIFQTAPLILIHMDVWGQLDRPAHEQGLHTAGLLLLLAAHREHGTLGGQTGEPEQISRQKKHTQRKEYAK